MNKLLKENSGVTGVGDVSKYYGVEPLDVRHWASANGVPQVGGTYVFRAEDLKLFEADLEGAEFPSAKAIDDAEDDDEDDDDEDDDDAQALEAQADDLEDEADDLVEQANLLRKRAARADPKSSQK
jgi:hypothetical protein